MISATPIGLPLPGRAPTTPRATCRATAGRRPGPGSSPPRDGSAGRCRSSSSPARRCARPSSALPPGRSRSRWSPSRSRGRSPGRAGRRGAAPSCRRAAAGFGSAPQTAQADRQDRRYRAAASFMRTSFAAEAPIRTKRRISARILSAVQAAGCGRTGVSGGRPLSTAMTLLTARSTIAVRVSRVALPRCGASTTFSIVSSASWTIGSRS